MPSNGAKRECLSALSGCFEVDRLMVSFTEPVAADPPVHAGGPSCYK